MRILFLGAGALGGYFGGRMTAGGADVTLTEDGDTTIMHYEAKAEIGGKIAQLGSRLIQSTAKKLAAKFFQSFVTVVNERVTA